MPSFTPPEGVDLEAYAEALLDRFRNPAIHHLTWQIAMDGSQKLPQRILGTLGDNRAAGRSSPGARPRRRRLDALRRRRGRTRARHRRARSLAARLKDLSDSAETPEGKVPALLSVGGVFPSSLAADLSFRDALATAYQALLTAGAKASVARLAAASN
jgi:fructuronate reductase